MTVVLSREPGRGIADGRFVGPELTAECVCARLLVERPVAAGQTFLDTASPGSASLHVVGGETGDMCSVRLDRSVWSP